MLLACLQDVLPLGTVDQAEDVAPQHQRMQRLLLVGLDQGMNLAAIAAIEPCFNRPRQAAAGLVQSPRRRNGASPQPSWPREHAKSSFSSEESSPGRLGHPPAWRSRPAGDLIQRYAMPFL